MKILTFIFWVCLLCVTAEAQYRTVETIDFNGARTLSEQQLRDALQIKEREQSPSSEIIEQAIKRLTALPNVEQADITTVCCVVDRNSKVMLYVGIREKGSPPVLEFRVTSQGAIRLTDEIVNTGKEFVVALREAGFKDDLAEDVSQGHSLMKNAEARLVQKKFIGIAANNLKLLRQVLRESADPTHRALAAQIIAYSADKKLVVEDLLYGMRDSYSDVRNDSMRALGIIAEYGRNTPEKKISVPFAPFVDLLNSIVWSDRYKSSLALLRLTENRDAKLLAELRERALPSLFNMARWKNQKHSLAGFMILGRIGNLPEDEIAQAATRGIWEDLLAKMQKNLQP